MRFVGVKRNRICVVSDNLFNNDGLEIMELPPELSHIPAADLIANCTIKNNKIKCKNIKKPANQLKVALVSNYGTKCGIGTYSKFLYDEMIKLVGDYKLFIEYQEKYDIENPQIPNDKIIACWKRGESLTELVKEIKNYDPDIILIQLEFGLFPNARYWLSLLSQLSNYRIITTMHSVFPDHKDKIVYEAAMPEIIVHLEGARNNLLHDKKVNGKVYVIPHGCYPISNQNKLWNVYKSEHTFIQQGFGFEYKNFEDSIKAVAILKEKYPDVFFTGLFSQSDYNMIGHTIYFNKLIALIEELSIQDNVSIIRGYQSETIIDSYLRTNQVGIFPYKSVEGHMVFGSSGASRLAMSAGIPIITSSIPHFSDMPTIKADTPEQIANELDKLFSDKKIRQLQIDKQNQFIIDNSWENVAKKYIEIFEL